MKLYKRSMSISASCGTKKKAVTGEDEVYDVVMEEDYGPTTGRRTLHKGLDRASARSAVRHYNKRAMPNQRFYEETEEDRLGRRPVRSSTRVTAAQRDSSAVVNKARDIYASLCDLYFDMTQGANAPFSEEGAPAYYLDKAISAIDDIYAFGLSEEDREAMSVDGATCISGAATDSLAQQIYDFLDEEGGYTDYDQKIEDVMEAFGLSHDSAESYVWDWSSGLNKLDDEGEYETEGAASIEIDGDVARDFGASLLQELVEARVDGISIYNVEIGRNLTTFYYEINDAEYTPEDINRQIDIAMDEIIGDSEEGQFD